MSLIDAGAALAGQSGRRWPVGAITVCVISVICVIIYLALLSWSSPGAIIWPIILATVTLVGMTAIVLVLDQMNPSPRYLMVTVCLWGAGIAVLASMVLELGMRAILPISDTVLMTVVAPVVEEAAKGLAVLGVFMFRRSDMPSLTDGVVYASLSALGFAAFENIGYYASASGVSAGAIGVVFVMRGVLSPFCHPLFTSMTGLGLVMAVRKMGSARVGWPILGFLAAIALHGLWNGSTVFGLQGVVTAYLMEGGALALVLVFTNNDRKAIMARSATCLAQYVPFGVVTSADLATLHDMRTRKTIRSWVERVNGKIGGAAVRNYQAACTKLTLLHDRWAAGTISPQEFYGRQQLLLTLMRVVYGQFRHPLLTTYPTMTWYPGVYGHPTNPYQVAAPYAGTRAVVAYSAAAYPSMPYTPGQQVPPVYRPPYPPGLYSAVITQTVPLPTTAPVSAPPPYGQPVNGPSPVLAPPGTWPPPAASATVASPQVAAPVSAPSPYAQPVNGPSPVFAPPSAWPAPAAGTTGASPQMAAPASAPSPYAQPVIAPSPVVAQPGTWPTPSVCTTETTQAVPPQTNPAPTLAPVSATSTPPPVEQSSQPVIPSFAPAPTSIPAYAPPPYTSFPPPTGMPAQG